MTRTGSAVWNGGIKEGNGTVSTETKVLDQAGYGFDARFSDGKGTNPEELLGAAHAACFSMALAGRLNKEGLNPESINTTSAITIEKDGDGFTITKAHLTVKASVPGATAEQFQQCAKDVESGCPVSKVLNATITMDASLA